jgi:hypothetical protein
MLIYVLYIRVCCDMLKQILLEAIQEMFYIRHAKEKFEKKENM